MVRCGFVFGHRGQPGHGVTGVLADTIAIDRIAGVIRSFDGTPMAYSGVVTPETSIVRDLRFDSLSVMDFVMAIETEFDVIIPIDRISEIETVGDLAHRLQEQTAGKQG